MFSPPRRSLRLQARAGHGPISPQLPSSQNSGAQSPSLHGYHKLPPEIQRYIIDLACLAPLSHHSLFHIDNATILNLTLVSRSFHDQFQRRLYRNIALTRPTALSALYYHLGGFPRLLGRYPRQRELIKSIHIGPIDNLPPHWWPLSDAYPAGEGWAPRDQQYHGEPFDYIASSLDRTHLPRGYQDRQAFPFDRLLTGLSCREAAIHEALSVAQRFINVDLANQDRGRRPPMDVGNVWLARVYEVQAALDLYLTKVRSLEDASPHLARQAQPGARVPAVCRHRKCACYPPLHISDKSASSVENAPRGAFKVTRAALLAHLSRPGAVTDRFDHPITLARSNFAIRIDEPPGQGYEDYSSEHGAHYEVYSENWAAERYHEDHSCPDVAFLNAHDSLGAQSSQLLPTSTLGSNLYFARALLTYLVPRLENLSLTGYLEQALNYTGDQLRRSLRRLAVGPMPPGWHLQVRLHDLRNVEQLRVAGTLLDDWQIKSIREMKRLEAVEWSQVAEYPSNVLETSMTQAFELLLRRRDSPATSKSSSASDGAEEGEDESTSAASSSSSQRSSSLSSEGEPCAPLITATFHPSDVAKVLATAPSAEVRAAWLAGQEVAGSAFRLKLKQRAVNSGSDEEWVWAHGLACEAFYEELRRWWRRIAR